VTATRNETRSAALYERARRAIPGGVNSPVRAMRAIGRDPLFIERGEGAEIVDADGNRYLDYVCSWGALVAGHAHPAVLAAIAAAAAAGTSFGAPTEGEVELAEEVARRIPVAQMLRMTSSGTEAAMTAIRIARAHTGRDLVVKFAGAYHGHSDGLLAAAGSGLATQGIPASPGVPAGAAAATVVVPWNDADALLAAVAREDVAAIIAEPLPANMGLVPAADGFLELLRERADACGALLVLDEVISGFRVARGGVQEQSGVSADLIIMGKVIGGGLPAAALGGPAELMRMLAPAGDVYQAGTLSGNPVAVAAGLATIKRLDEHSYVGLEGIGRVLEDELARAVRRTNVTARVQRVGSAFTLFFTTEEVVDLASAKKSDTAQYARYFHGMLERGYLLPPAQFEAAFVSLAHTLEDVQGFVTAAREVLTQIKDPPTA
jgi:glutamate-1-semialdehyde 2,1-aminomutase